MEGCSCRKSSLLSLVNWGTEPPWIWIHQHVCFVDRATWPVLSGSQQLHFGNPYGSPLLSVLICVERRGKTKSLAQAHRIVRDQTLGAGREVFCLGVLSHQWCCRTGAAGQQCLSSPALEEKGSHEQGAWDASCDNQAKNFNSFFDQFRTNFLQLSLGSGLPISSFPWAQH